MREIRYRRWKTILIVAVCCLLFPHAGFVSQASEVNDSKQSVLESIIKDSSTIIQGEINIDEVQSSGEIIYEESIDQLLDNLDFSELNDFLEGSEAEVSMSFGELVKTLISENGQVDKKWFFSQIWSLLASELKESRPIFIQILIMCVAFALLNNFAMVFKNSQIHKSCFFVFYLALITLLMKAYLISSQLLTGVMDSLVEFMQALIPAFCMALSFTTAISSAAVFYQVIILAIYLIERIIVYAVIPGIHIYVVLMMLNHLTEEELISGITDLLKKGITWVLRLMIGGITGINILQNLIAPAVDSLKNTAVTKAISAIPGVGSAANALTSMFLGSAVVIKNGIGVTAIVVLLILVLSPLIKLAFLTLLYKLTGAVVQPIADKRVYGCISGVGEGAKMLLHVLVTALMMFMVSIAMVTASVRI